MPRDLACLLDRRGTAYVNDLNQRHIRKLASQLSETIHRDRVDELHRVRSSIKDLPPDVAGIRLACEQEAADVGVGSRDLSNLSIGDGPLAAWHPGHEADRIGAMALSSLCLLLGRDAADLYVDHGSRRLADRTLSRDIRSRGFEDVANHDALLSSGFVGHCPRSLLGGAFDRFVEDFCGTSRI